MRSSFALLLVAAMAGAVGVGCVDPPPADPPVSPGVPPLPTVILPDAGPTSLDAGPAIPQAPTPHFGVTAGGGTATSERYRATLRLGGAPSPGPASSARYQAELGALSPPPP